MVIRFSFAIALVDNFVYLQDFLIEIYYFIMLKYFLKVKFVFIYVFVHFVFLAQKIWLLNRIWLINFPVIVLLICVKSLLILTKTVFVF